MAKSYLITLTESDLQTLVFSVVDRAIKLNKLAGNYSDIPIKMQAPKKETIAEPKIEKIHG